MFEIEKGQPFYYSLMSLVIFGHIPKNMRKSTMRIFSIHNFLIKCMFFFCNCVLLIVHLITSVKGSDKINISDDMVFGYGSVSALLLVTLYTSKWKEWSKLFYDLTKNTEFGFHPYYHRLTKLLKSTSLGYSLFTTAMGLIYGLIAHLATTSCEETNKEYGLHEICGTFSAIWLPVESISTWLTRFIFFVQLYLFICVITSSGIISILAWETTEILISHMRKLRWHFRTMFDVTEKRERIDRLRFCVKYHNHVLGLGYRLSALFKYTFGVASISSALALGFIGNQIKDNPIGALSYLVSYLVAMFALCHAGQRLKDETFAVAEAVYDSKWYDVDVNMIKDVQFIIARSQKEIVLETLPFGHFDYPLYLLMIKTAYSYLTLLSQTV